MEDFVKALLLMADQHETSADAARRMIDHTPERTRGPMGDTWRRWQKEMNYFYGAQATEQQGLADVYKQFAYDVAMLEALPLTR